MRAMASANAWAPTCVPSALAEELFSEVIGIPRHGIGLTRAYGAAGRDEDGGSRESRVHWVSLKLCEVSIFGVAALAGFADTMAV
jgi:hypothetical protein